MDSEKKPYTVHFDDGEPWIYRGESPVTFYDAAELLNTLTAESARLREACRKIVEASGLDPYDSGTLRHVIDQARSALTPTAAKETKP